MATVPCAPCRLWGVRACLIELLALVGLPGIPYKVLPLCLCGCLVCACVCVRAQYVCVCVHLSICPGCGVPWLSSVGAGVRCV